MAGEDALALLRGRLDEWRRTRRRGTHIPAPLWEAAVEAARRHGIWKTAQQLRIDYYSLKRRMRTAAAPAKAEAVRFVELAPPASSEGPAGVVEMHDARGRRLRVEVRNESLVEPLARSLWSFPR